MALNVSKAILEKKWTFLLYHSQHPNAFVTGLLPNHVFVASALLHKVLFFTHTLLNFSHPPVFLFLSFPTFPIHVLLARSLSLSKRE
jgi:putative flippase GtrA